MRCAIIYTLVAILVAACATSPLGRRQLKLVSDEQMSQMGVQAFRDMQKKVPQTKDESQTRYVNCVASAITREVGGGQTWEVSVFDDKQVNAFALPGGKIGVYTGLLKVAATQDQLAAVLGHEVSHVLAGHSAERVSDQMVANLGGEVAGAVTGMDPRVFGMATNVFFLLPFSRSHETEADLLGMDLMARAGFDPHESISLWQNMRKAGGDKPPELMSTHPSDQRRIQQLADRLPHSMPLYEQAKAAGKNPRCS